MADNHTMEELLQAPTEGYGEAIVIPKINADHFEIKTNLLRLVQVNPYHGFEREHPHNHINNFKRITLTLKFKDVLNDKNLEEISRFTQRFEETFGEAWEQFKEMLKACPHHGFTKLAQIDTFYNGLNDNDQDFLNATAGRNLLRVPQSGIPLRCNFGGMKVVERETEKTTDKEKTNFQGSTAHIQPPVIPIPEPDVSKTLPKPNIPYPSRLNDQKLQEKARNQMEKFFQIFQDFHFDISFADALLLMPKFASTIKSLLTNKDNFADALLLIPKFASTIKSLLTNKDKLFELAKIPLNDNFSAMLLKKLPEKLGDPGKFFIPCDFPGIDGSDFILEEIEAYLKDESISPEINHAYCDSEGDIFLIENLLNNDPFQLPPMDLKQGELVKEKISIAEPPKLKLKDLPSHLEYAYLEGVDKLPVIIA
nr:reverse transcriptase domain-containing protein [Tanacetum cinerariifolium]